MSNVFSRSVANLSPLNAKQIKKFIPPYKIDPESAGVHSDFLQTWDTALQSPSVLVDRNDEERFDEPDSVDRPDTFAHKHNAMDVFSLDDLCGNEPLFNPACAQSFWCNTITALGTCLAFRQTNTAERSSPSQTSGFPDYYVPYRVLIDFVRTMEVICVQHFQHDPTNTDIQKFWSKFDPNRPESVTDASGLFTPDMQWYFKTPPKLFDEKGTQSDPLPCVFEEEKEKPVESPPSVQDMSTQTELVTTGFCCLSEEKEATVLSPFQPETPPKSETLPKQTTAPNLSPIQEPSAQRTPTPKPMSESGDSSRFTPKRVSVQPHIVLSRVYNADAMNYRDARRMWDSALDDFSPPSPDLFYSSNIYRFRRLGMTGLGIIFRQEPTHKQLKRFVASCLKQQGRDAFNSVFRSVSSGGVHVAMYDKAHRSPPYPTQLKFEDVRKTQPWSPPPPVFRTQPPQQPHFPPQHFQSRRPAPPRFPTPSFGNVFPTHPHPQQHNFQRQITQLQQQMTQLMTMQTHIFQQLQQMKYNG